MNKELISKFLITIQAEGLGKLRIKKYQGTLQNVSKMIKKDFQECSRADIEGLVAQIEASNYADWTKHDYKVVIKRFWRWLKKVDDGYPPEVSWVKTTMKKNHEKLPEELLTEDEVALLIQNTDSIRDKALISTLYESGARVGEIASLRVKNVSFEEHGVSIHVQGKTGSRKILLLNSTPYLANWLSHHPKNEPNSPLWLNSRSNGKALKVSYNTIRSILIETGKRAGLKKKLNPHNFRHSRATYLAKRLTEQQLNAYMGWVQGSDMTRTYVHLSGRDINDAILQMHGIKKAEIEPNGGSMKPRKCPRCQKDNQFEAKMCCVCGMPLDIESALEREKKLTEFARVIDTPDILERIIERKVNEILSIRLKN